MRSIVCMRSSRARSAIAIRKHDRLGRNSDGKGMRERTEHEPSTAVYIRRRASVSSRRRGDRRAHVGSWPASASACWCSCCQPRRSASVSLIPNVDRDRVVRHVLPRVAEWRCGGSLLRSDLLTASLAPHEMQYCVWWPLCLVFTIVPFGVTYEKIGTIQRRLAWPLHKDDTLSRSGRPTGLNIYFPRFLRASTTASLHHSRCDFEHLVRRKCRMATQRVNGLRQPS